MTTPERGHSEVHEHRLRRYCDLLDSMSELGAEIAGDASSAQEIVLIDDLRHALELGAYGLRRCAMTLVPKTGTRDNDGEGDDGHPPESAA